MLKYRVRMWWWRLDTKSKMMVIAMPQVLLLTWFMFFSSPIAPYSGDPRLEGIPELIDWALEGGLQAPKLKIIMTERGKTMISEEDHPAGPLFKVPYSLLLCGYLNEAEELASNPAWAVIAELDFNEHWSEALLMLAEKQKGKSAWFHHYLDTITKREDLSLPFFWKKKEDLNALEGEWMRDWLVYEPRREFDTYWPKVQKLVRDNPTVLDPKVFTYENLEWSASLIWSHAFNSFRGKTAFATAVPVVDMMNHENDLETWWEIDDENQLWVLQTNRDIKKGDEIVINYGDMPNVRLLKWFGFALDDNKYDAYFYRLPLPEQDPQYAEKLPIMERIGWDWVEVTKEGASPELLSLARIITLEPSEFDWTPKISQKAPPHIRISCSNERKALSFLLRESEKLLAEFSTTIEEDERLIRSGGISNNMRNAILLRKGHKVILKAVKEDLNDRLLKEIC